MLLIMTEEKRVGGTNLSPFRKSLTMPFVIFWDGVELGQIVTQNFDVRIANTAGKVFLLFIIAIVMLGIAMM